VAALQTRIRAVRSRMDASDALSAARISSSNLIDGQMIFFCARISRCFYKPAAICLRPSLKSGAFTN
jgi:hypothetical protein